MTAYEHIEDINNYPAQYEFSAIKNQILKDYNEHLYFIAYNLSDTFSFTYNS